jgi:hypothetical protein
MPEQTFKEKLGEPLEKEMEKVRSAPHGELILLVDPHIGFAVIDALGIPQNIRHNIIFKSVLGVYEGIANHSYLEEALHYDYTFKKSDHPAVEFDIVKTLDVPVPLILENPSSYALNVSTKGKIYVGPDEIRKVLKSEGMGLFNEFFENYVSAHRNNSLKQ